MHLSELGSLAILQKRGFRTQRYGGEVSLASHNSKLACLLVQFPCSERDDCTSILAPSILMPKNVGKSRAWAIEQSHNMQGSLSLILRNAITGKNIRLGSQRCSSPRQDWKAPHRKENTLGIPYMNTQTRCNERYSHLLTGPCRQDPIFSAQCNCQASLKIVPFCCL